MFSAGKTVGIGSVFNAGKTEGIGSARARTAGKGWCGCVLSEGGVVCAGVSVERRGNR